MRERLHRLLRFVVIAYCWAALVGNTIFFCSLAAILRPFRGVRVWNDLLHRWACVSMALGRFELGVAGREHLRSPAVFAANHQSIFDIAILAAVIPPPIHFIAREDLLRVPFVGLVLRKGRHVIVPRSGGRQRVDSTVRQALQRLREGGSVVFFPEGHRSADGTVGPFKPGAFRIAALAGVPLVPVAIAGSGGVVPKGSRAILPCRLRVELQPPLAVSKAASEAAAVRRQIAGRVNELRPETGPFLAQAWAEEGVRSSVETRAS